MARTFQPDHNGINQIARQPEVVAALLEVAETMKAKAEAEAETFRSTDEHPHYADSFKTGRTTVEWKGEYPGMRACAMLQNTSDHADEVEWGYEAHKKDGTVTPVSGHHVLLHTLEAMGRG